MSPHYNKYAVKTKILLETIGGYPRIGDEPRQQILRKTIDLWEKGKKIEKELRRSQDDLTREVILEQVECGIDIPTDGLVRWYDPISHIMQRIGNVEIKGLLRFFDTNCYFRQPLIKGKPEWTRHILVDEFLFAKGVNESLAEPRFCVKQVLTGPYTLARHSIAGNYNVAKLTEALADVLAREVGELAKNGAKIIQIDEPSILKNAGDWDLVASALEKIAREKGGAMLSLATYFGDAAPLYEKMQELPVVALHFDLTYSPGIVDKVLSVGSKKLLGLGIVDGRNTRIEDAGEVARVVGRII
ncbi:MAG: hypothetical protein A2W23_03975, partial [Planctomycetes bacterium RBG_16_43_13]